MHITRKTKVKLTREDVETAVLQFVDARFNLQDSTVAFNVKEVTEEYPVAFCEVDYRHVGWDITATVTGQEK